ncbi:MAG: glycosyltransferase family 4 protein [Acidobacteriota bacterium]
MRILQISSTRSLGGGERHVAGLSNELVKRGHEVYAAVVSASPLTDILQDVPRHNIAEFPLRNALDISTAISVAKFVRANRVELINAHFAKDYPVAAAAARFARVPFVITRHVLFPMNRLHRIFLRDVSYVLAPSNAVAGNLRSQGLFPTHKIVTIRYGLDVDDFPIRSRGFAETLCIGSIGNLDPVKGFDVLIRGAEIVSKQKPGVKFKIVGEDRSRDRRHEKAIRRLITDMNLGSLVELAGWSNNVSDMLAGFDIFISASRSESFGFVIAEAMLTGIPVIATETEGAREIISAPSLGRLVPIDSSQGLANAILELLNDSNKRSELGQHGRDHVKKNFSLQRMVDETEKLYQRIITAE